MSFDLREQYERAFRQNRDDAIANHFDVVCAICGCGYDCYSERTDDVEHLHRLYDALAADARL